MAKRNTKTTIVETGNFTRVLERSGKRKRQKTQRHKRNPEKVTLYKVGDLELYAYPYTNPDQMFIGSYPDFNMAITKADLSRLFGLYIKARWFLNGCWQNRRFKTKTAKSASTSICKSYDYGLKHLKKTAKRRKKTLL